MNKVLLYCILSFLIVKVINEACSTQGENSSIKDFECKELTVADDENICVKGESGCEETKRCEYQGTKDTCSEYPTSNGYKCYKTTEGSCDKQQVECGDETDTDVDNNYCQKLKVDDGYKCIKGSEKCEPEQIMCGAEGDGNGSSELCGLLKVNDAEHQVCVKHETQTKCIIAENCEEVKVDATVEICAKLSVDSGKKCLKEGFACVAKTICNEAAGTSDDDCKDFWVSDSNSKKCAKKEGEDKCEEVSKAEEEQPTPNTPATEAQPTQQQTPNPTPTPTSEASQNTQSQNTQPTQNSQTTSSDTASSTTKATKSSNLSSADGIKMSLMILIIMFIL